ncbi:hypothetical protein [Streptomyces ziwulingensis]|uniref:AAA+ ATPase domain-containing protein n=1 Tax=Streptomyces ziwulingensis TaxID=1045501 RepID=A0ABP9CS19_9ACTN
MQGSGRTQLTTDQDAYRTTLALHALAVLTRRPGGSPAEAVRLVRALTDGTSRLSAAAPVPMDSLRYAAPREQMSGAGALIAEDMTPGSMGLLAHLAALREAGLVEGLYEFVTRAEDLHPADGPPSRIPLPATPAPRGTVHTLLRPSGSWSVIAAVTAEFSARATTPPGAAATGQPVTEPAASWSPLSDGFRTEAELATAQARQLAKVRGRPQPPAVSVTFACPDILFPSAVQDGVSAAAVALTYLAQEAELPSPAEKNVFVMAGIAPDGRWTAAPDSRQLWETARAGGLAILSRSAEGWVLKGQGAPRTSTDHSLNGAAELLWEDEWDATRDRWHTEVLREQGWRVLYTTPGPGAAQDVSTWQRNPEEPPLAEADQAGALQTQYLLQPRLGMVLGGPPNSGKTVIARQLTAKLEGRRWNVLTLAPIDRQLPVQGDLPGLVRSAMHLHGITPGAKTLVVIEDLHPLTRGNLGRAVSSLVSELEVGVLALARFAENSHVEWDSTDVSPMTAVVGQTEVADLAARMIEQHPDTYGRAAQVLPQLQEEARGDLWLLSRFMRDAAVTPAAGRPADTASWGTTEILAAASPADRTGLRLVAAVSRLGEGVPEDYLPASTRDLLATVGVRALRGLIQIPSRQYARTLLRAVVPAPEAGAGAGTGAGTELEHLLETAEAYLLRLLEENRVRPLIGLLQMCRAYDPILLGRLLSGTAARDALAQWTTVGDVAAAAVVLTICDRYLGVDWVVPRLPALMTRVLASACLPVRGLSSVLRLMSYYQHQLRHTDEFEAFMLWLAKPGEGLDAVMRGPARIADRYHLARRVFRLDHESSPGLLLALMDTLVRDVRPDVVEDLVHVRKLDVLLQRCHRRVVLPGKERSRCPLEKYAEVQDLLEHRPPGDASFGVVIGWMSLQLHFNEKKIDWDHFISSHELGVRAALGRATAAELSLVLSDLAQNHRGFCTRLLHKIRMAEPLRAILREAAPTGAAHLISVLANIHSVTVQYLLYREAGGAFEVDATLARALAGRVLKLKDGKGAGLLLSATHRVDELYCHTGRTFAGELAAQLGESFALELLGRERRPSILYYFLRGLWEAEAAYRQKAEGSAFRLIVESIGSPYRVHRPWAARLALLLCEDDYFGEELLTRLSEAIDPALLAQRMTERGLRAESLTYLHRLAQAVHPDIPRRYRARFDMEHLLASLVPASADSVALRLRVTASTLRMSGEESANARLLATFKEHDPSWNWPEEIRKAGTTAALVQSLDHVRKLDPMLATSVVHALDEVGEEQQSSFLMDAVLRSALFPEQLAGLLRAVDVIQPGAGTRLLTALRTRRGWDDFTEEFQYEQDPGNQGRLGRQLARFGLLPRQGNVSWMKALVHDKWLRIVQNLASPRAVCELLKLTYIWDEQWGHQIAASVDGGRLLSRVDRRSTADLREVPGLLHILALAGRRELAQELIDRMTAVEPDVLARSLGIRGASQLLRRLHVLSRGDVDRFGAATARLLESVMERHLVVAPDDHWASIGWAAQALREVGLEQLLPTREPNVAVNVAYGAEVSWAATWLPESPWRTAALEAALPAFKRSVRTWRQSEHTAMALIASARAGLIQDLADNETYWSLIAEASPGVLTLAYRCAPDDETLTGFLRSLTPAVDKRLRSPVHHIDPWLTELRTLLRGLSGPGQQRPALFAPGGPLAPR